MDEKKMFYRKDEILKMFGVTNATIDRWEKQGDFPKSIKISSRFRGWFTTDIDNWLGALRSHESNA